MTPTKWWVRERLARLGVVICRFMHVFQSCRIPESAKIGNKMIYLSSKDAMKKYLSGISIEFQVNEPEDMDYDQLADTIEKKYRAL